MNRANIIKKRGNNTFFRLEIKTRSMDYYKDVLGAKKDNK